MSQDKQMSGDGSVCMLCGYIMGVYWELINVVRMTFCPHCSKRIVREGEK